MSLGTNWTNDFFYIYKGSRYCFLLKATIDIWKQCFDKINETVSIPMFDPDASVGRFGN